MLLFSTYVDFLSTHVCSFSMYEGAMMDPEPLDPFLGQSPSLAIHCHIFSINFHVKRSAFSWQCIIPFKEMMNPNQFSMPTRKCKRWIFSEGEIKIVHKQAIKVAYGCKFTRHVGPKSGGWCCPLKYYPSKSGHPLDHNEPDPITSFGQPVRGPVMI